MSQTVSLICIIVAFVFLLISFINLVTKNRNIAKVFETLALWALFIYSCRYVGNFEHIFSGNIEVYISLLFFGSMLIAAITKTVLLIKYK